VANVFTKNVTNINEPLFVVAPFKVAKAKQVGKIGEHDHHRNLI
jgi:hypothetical protein